MVLDHIANRAGAVVVAAAPFHADLFGHQNLYVIDVAAIPERLKDAVAESKGQNVLDGFFAQIMVDPIDLAFIEHAQHMAVERLSACQVAPKRLLDNDPRPSSGFTLVWRRAMEPSFAQPRHNQRVGFWWRGQVEQAVACVWRNPTRL